MSCILASMAAVKTRIVAFDTNIVDLTDKCSDPVDLLFGFQLGGGTDIDKSVAYCQQFIENPKKNSVFSGYRSGGGRQPGLSSAPPGGDQAVRGLCHLPAGYLRQRKALL